MTRLLRDDTEAPRFSRQWWIDWTRQLIWVAVVTVLIWIYADMEFIKTDRTTITVRLVAGDPDKAVLLGEDGQVVPYRDVRLTFRARGSQNNLETFKRRLSTSGPTFRYDVAEGRQPGLQQVSAMEILQQTPDLERLAINILDATPDVDVVLNEVIQEKVPVLVNVTGAAAPPPVEVLVNVPRARWREILAKPKAEQVLRTEPVDLGEYDPNETVTIDARIIPEIAGVKVRLPNPVLRIPVRIVREAGPELQEYTLEVNVRLLTPAEWVKDDVWRKFTFQQDTDRTPWTKVPIRVEGPPDEIARLKQRLDEVRAYVELTKDDLKDNETPWTRTITLDLPDKVRVKVLGELPKVSWLIRERTGDATPP